MSSTATPVATPPSLWTNRVFLIVASADLLQQIGIWVRNMALLFAVTEMTNGNAVAISLLTVFEMAPIFIFSLIGGVFADRWNPKWTVVIGDLLSALSIVVIMLCLASGIWQAVFLATVVSAIVSQFSVPSSSVIFKRHVPESQVPTAIGITQGLSSIFVIVGPIIGTSLYTMLGLQGSLIVLCCIFTLAALIQLALPSFKREKKEPTPVLEDIKAGIAYVWSHSSLRLLTLTQIVISLGVGLIQPLEIFIVTERLGLPKESLPWITTAAGVGLFVGISIASACGTFIQKHRKIIFAVAILGLAISLVIEGWSTILWLTLSIRFLSGLLLAALQVILSTWFIQFVDENYIGRVNGITMPLYTAGIMIASAMAGFLKEQFSLVAVFTLSGIVVALSAWLSLYINLSLAKQPAKEAENVEVGKSLSTAK
ncbi:MFS transporter [Paenibacillus sp. SC116]|uniref:MFS transporter n=1 Tax=Paenibacillus sp. SC116 TaxID=2968986 RepID=UPI00215A948B|nr:MFS transporter [Paenibacillus sp. SC116]MCR8843040.1 MFS transporter [Paenibacillus sp. SC116]